MRRVLFGMFLASLACLTGCGRSAGRLEPGDTVMPILEGGSKWTAGTPTELSVRLQAQAADGAAAKPLDFSTVPADVNPVARITFYENDQALPPKEVVLAHRC